MWINWRNEGFDSDSVVENYVQWEDPEKEGEFIGMTCQKNRQDNDFLDIIENVRSTTQYRVGLGEEGIYRQAEPTEVEKDWVKAKANRSICSAKAVMWSTTDGKDDDASLNDRYYRLNENGNNTLTISSGYKVWKNNSESEIINTGHAPQFDYQLRDLGKTRPKVKKELPIASVKLDNTIATEEFTFDWQPVIVIGVFISINLGILKSKGII